MISQLVYNLKISSATHNEYDIKEGNIVNYKTLSSKMGNKIKDTPFVFKYVIFNCSTPTKKSE